MRPRMKVLALCLAVIVVAPGGETTAEAPGGWPGWRGANRDGKSAETGLLKSWPAGGPKRLWAVKGIGTGFSGVSAGGGLIYTTGHKHNTLWITAIDPAKGKIAWARGVTDAAHEEPAGSRATPTYDNGLLYLEAGTGVVGCYAAKNGRKKWTRKMSEFGGRADTWAYSESVLIVGKLAIVSPGGDNFMVALDKVTGKTVWTSGQFGWAHYSSPIHVVHEGVSMIVNGGRNGLIGVDAKTGKILWTQEFASGNVANCPTPAYSDGYVFWAVGYDQGAICLKLKASGRKVKATVAWENMDMVCHHGGYVILDGHVYGNHDDGWTCLDLKTGARKWYDRGVGKGSLCAADGMLYLFSEAEGKAALAAASPKGMKLVGTVSVKGKGPSWAHPVVTGGRLYLRYDDTLYCFDVTR